MKSRYVIVLIAIASVAMGIGAFLFMTAEHARGGVYLRNFESTQELQSWLDKTISVTFTCDSEGIASFSQSERVTILGQPVGTSDCDDYAMALQQRAIQDGYNLSLALTDMMGNVGPINVATEYHMGCLAIIGNEMWYVEPLKVSIRFVGPLD